MTTMVYCHIGILILLTIISNVSTEDCNPQKCRVLRIKKMPSADCYDMDIHTFPTCLPSNLEVIDLSYNRIRHLKKGDLANYSSLKLLYLQDNLISSIEEGFFKGADSLVAVDLSINGISELPQEIFQLPSLTKLYLSQSLNMNIAEVIEKAKPIKSPLAKIDISFNDLKHLPDLGEMVHLISYNISGNDLVGLTPRNFAGLCNLQFLHNNNMTVQFKSSCDCMLINNWLTQRNVKFEPFDCTVSFQELCTKTLDAESLGAYEKCKEQYKKIVTQKKILTIALPCVVILLVIAIGLTYYIYKKKQQKKRRNRMMNSGGVLDPLKERHDHIVSEFNRKNNSRHIFNET